MKNTQFKKPDAYKSINSSQFINIKQNNNKEEDNFYLLINYFKKIYLKCI
jgi:hypothetical protein